MKHDPDENQKRYILPMEKIAVKLGEGVDGKEVTAPDELMVFRKGVFNHPFFGHFALTEEMLRKMKENFDNSVRRIDIAGDWEHRASTAPFWLDEVVLKNKDSELWVNIGWTKAGRESVEAQDYRYTSGEFDDNYKDAETAQEFGPTLLGVALTNRPFIKGMQPITALSESVEEFLEGKLKENEPMTKEEQAQFDALKKQLDDLEAKGKKLTETGDELATANKLAETQAAELKTLKEANEKTEEEKATAEKKATFDKMLSESKVCEAQRKAYMSDDMAKFSELTQSMNPKPAGSAGDGKGDDKNKTVGVTLKEGEDVEEKVIELADKMQKEDKDLSNGDAIGKVLVANPKLNEEYEKKTA